MRRPAATLPINLQQLKHFAAATVAITSLLALLAGGEDAGVAAQIQATQAKNDLIAAEQKKLGTKKLATSLGVRKHSAGSFGGDDSGDGGDGGFGSGGGGGSQAAPPSAARPGANPADRFIPPEKLPRNPGESVTFSGVPETVDPTRPGSGKSKSQPTRGDQPSPQDLANIRDTSRQRSGSSDE